MRAAAWILLAVAATLDASAQESAAPRRQGAAPDIGAYEFKPAASNRNDVEYVEPDAGSGRSAAVIVGPVPLLHTAQVFPVDPKGRLVGQGDSSAQIDQVLKNLSAILEEGGSSLEGIVKLNVHAARLHVVAEVQEVLAKRFAGAAKPAVGYVTGELPCEEALVSMDAVAVTRSASAGGDRPVPLVSSKAIFRPTGFVHAAVLPPGTKVYVSGQAEAGRTSGEAARSTMEKLKSILDHLRLEPSRVVQVKAFVQILAEKEEIRKEILRAFEPGECPPLVLVEWANRSTRPVEIELVVAGKEGEGGPRIEFINPPGTKASTQFTHVVRIRSPRVIYTSGLYGTGETPEAELTSLFETLSGLLEKTGSDFEHLAKATYSLADPAAAKKIYDVRPRFYPPTRPPAASLIHVAGAGAQRKRVTLDMIAIPSK